MRRVIGPCPLGAECEKVGELAGEKVLFVCPWYQKLRGKDPQSDQEVDEWRCAIGWLPMLHVEHSMFERQTGAAVESLRNETVNVQRKILEASQQRKVIPKIISNDQE